MTLIISFRNRRNGFSHLFASWVCWFHYGALKTPSFRLPWNLHLLPLLRNLKLLFHLILFMYLYGHLILLTVNLAKGFFLTYLFIRCWLGSPNDKFRNWCLLYWFYKGFVILNLFWDLWSIHDSDTQRNSILNL